ncbi:MAG: DUF3784 domain-containing protein [Lachnospiraceae bacterium]|nr:DUF3784 domain-containing protein [Lachnospiraceae bacterium]
MLLVIHIGIIMFLLLLGGIFWRGKGKCLIAGYNTMPSEEKARYDEKALCRFMGKFTFALAGCWLVIAAGSVRGNMTVFGIGLGILFIVFFAGVILANTGDRLRK